MGRIGDHMKQIRQTHKYCMFSLLCRIYTRVWGDVLAGKVLAMQAWTPQFRYQQDICTIPSVKRLNPGPKGLGAQPVQFNHWGPGSLRECVSKRRWRGMKEGPLTLTSDLHMHVHVCAHTNICIDTHKGKKKMKEGKRRSIGGWMGGAKRGWREVTMWPKCPGMETS